MKLDDAKLIIKKEYGKNISVFIIANDSEEVEEHELFFIQNFSKITFSNSYEQAWQYFDNHKGKFDLVVVHVSDNLGEAEKLLKHIRKQEELIHMIAFTTSKQTYEYTVGHCFCADATLPYPFNTEYTYRYLHRYLKRLTTVKEMESYVSVLENMLNTNHKSENSCYIGLDRVNDYNTNNNLENTIIEKRTIEDSKLKNIRFNQSHKTTAVEFMSTLDSSIIDKIEEFQDRLDDYAVYLYDLEKLNPENSINKMHEITIILTNFSQIVDNMITFPIIAETFVELTSFLDSLNIEHFEDITQKKLLVEVLLGLGKDLELWIKAIFIDQNTDNINYFDASFANSCLEIEAIFSNTINEKDDGDLEFF